MGAVDSPDLFDVVEGTHFRAEQVNDNVTGIQQYPVTMRHAFDLNLTQTHFLEQAKKVVGQRANMAVRTTGSHNHGIRHRALTAQIDQDQVLGFVEIQFGQDRVFQLGLTDRNRLAIVGVVLFVAVKISLFRMERFKGVRITLRRLGGYVVRVLRRMGAQRRAPERLPKGRL